MNNLHDKPDEILVVDDTPASLKLLEEILSHAGYKVRLASDGELALRSVKAKLPDLIMLDVRMPDMDGYEVCRRLKADETTRSIPVIFLSILEDEHEKVKAFQAGGIDYVNKPIRAAEVLARVNTHLTMLHIQSDLIQRNAELEAARANLEQRVEERSAELERVNANLQTQIDENLATVRTLKDSERQLADIIDFLPDATFVIDKDKRVIAWSRAMEDMTFVRKEDIIGKHYYEAAIPFYGVARPLLVEMLTVEDKELAAKYTYVKRIGETLYTEAPTPALYGGKGAHIWATASALYDSDGNTIGAIESVRDITERKNAEEALRESEMFLNNVVENIPDMLFVKDVKDLTFIRINAAGEKLLGYSRDELIGKVDSDFTTLQESEYFNKKDSEVISSKKFLDIPEEKISTRFLGERILHTKKMPILNSEGEPQYLLVIAEDITERKRTEEALVESEEQLRTLINAMPDIVCFKDGDGRWLQANDFDVNLFQLQHIDYHGKTDKELAELSSFYRETFLTCIDTDELAWQAGTVTRGDEVIPAPDGSRMTFDIIKLPLFDSDGRRKALVVIGRDITKRKKAEEEARELNENLEKRVHERTAQLEATNAELEAFIYSVSHDLRSPLRSIDGFSQAILDHYLHLLDERGQNYFHRIRMSAQRMGMLIDDLLRLSRVTRMEMRSKLVNVSEMAEEILAGLAKNEPQRKTKIIIKPDIKLEVDHDLLKIALENLLGNAWKFVGKENKGIIEFGVMCQNHEGVYFVRDNGVGFDMKYVEKLFEPFQRLHTDADFPGTGVGLAIVHRIIKRLGGRIWAEGKIGEGSTFYFTLPSSPNLGEAGKPC